MFFSFCFCGQRNSLKSSKLSKTYLKKIRHSQVGHGCCKFWLSTNPQFQIKLIDTSCRNADNRMRTSSAVPLSDGLSWALDKEQMCASCPNWNASTHFPIPIFPQHNRRITVSMVYHLCKDNSNQDYYRESSNCITYADVETAFLLASSANKSKV